MMVKITWHSKISVSLSFQSGDHYLGNILPVLFSNWSHSFMNKQNWSPNNDTAFSSRIIKIFVDDLGVWFWFHCTHVPRGNSIVERYHRRMKRIISLKQCSIMETVYVVQYNTKGFCFNFSCTYQHDIYLPSPGKRC